MSRDRFERPGRLSEGLGSFRVPETRRVNSLNSVKIIILAGSVLIAGNWINLKVLGSPEVAFWCANYGSIIMFFVNAISGILLVIGISKIISNCKLLQQIGRRTLEIYGCHEMIYQDT